MSCCWIPIPADTSAGGCSSHPLAKLGTMNETCGSLPSLRSLR